MGTKAAWDKMQLGDTVIFYAKRKLIMSGEVYYKIHNPHLALKLWPADENGNPWEFVFFIRNIKHFSVPMTVFNNIVGYKSNFIVQGFIHLPEERIQPIISQYDTMQNFFGHFADENSSEIPKSDEEIYVNVQEQLEVDIVLEPKLTPKSINLEVLPRGTAARKIDYVERSKKNAITGSKGEEIVLNEERKRLRSAGRSDLAKDVTRVSINDDSHGYDILSYELDGAERYIEVKTTTQVSNNVRFHLTSNEYIVASSLGNYYIVFVDKIDKKRPRLTYIADPINSGKFTVITDTYILEADRK